MGREIAMLDGFGRQFLKEAAANGIERVAAKLTQTSMRQIAFLLRPGDADKGQAPFFLHFLCFFQAPLVR